MEREIADKKSQRRILAVQQWLTARLIEVRQPGFYGELAISLKFEDGQCVLGEQSVREKTK